MSNKNLTIGLLITVVIAITGLFFPSAGQMVVKKLGGITNYDTIDVVKLRVSTSGSPISKIISNVCELQGNTSIAASTTKALDCQVPGVTSSDIVFSSFGTTTQTLLGMGQYFQLNGCFASSTNGWVTCQVTNFTGATANIPRQLASSTEILIVSTSTTLSTGL